MAKLVGFTKRRAPLAMPQVHVFDRWIPADEDYSKECASAAAELVDKWWRSGKQRWTYLQFVKVANRLMCTDYDKDFDNEFWTSEDPEVYGQAGWLSREKAFRDLYDIDCGDDVILFVMASCCPLSLCHQKCVAGFVQTLLTRKDVQDNVARIDGAAATIQQSWKRCVSDPAFRVCRCRLTREFAEW